MTVVDAYDAIRVNASRIPKGAQAAGYTTGSGIVPWDAAAWAAHPGAVRICQDPAGSDETADVYDVEAQAGLVANVARWAHAAQANYAAVKRHGQRRPAIYASVSMLTPICNALVAGGVRSGVGLWVAHWGIGRAAAVAMVQAGAGPFPVIGVQYDNKGPHGEPIDSDVFSLAWLDATAGSQPPPPPPDPGAPFRVVVPKGNTDSLSSIARPRDTTPTAIVEYSLPHLTAQHKTVLQDYLALENACFGADDVALPAMPAGMVYYLRHKP